MVQEKEKNCSNREVKSSAFTSLFSEPENAAALYQVLEGEEVSPEEIDYTTLSGVLFLARKNDMAFLAKNRVLVISEHQSTINQNMPLRDAIYYGRTMEQLIEPKALYRNRLIGIPTPEFYVFYNGNEVFPQEKTMKLSDSYLDKGKKGMLELEVKIININLPVQHPFLESCRPLFEYSYFIDKIKYYLRQSITRDEAIVKSMEDCRKEGILVEFFNKHGTEASNMLFTEFNMEDALEVRGEEKYEEGLEKGIEKGLSQGRCQSIIDILESYGEIGDDLKAKIVSETNHEVLKQWLWLAINVKSISGFEAGIKQ